jgi:signal transduction histidine kinase
MAALGEMAYAVAHELRNPLNVIRGLSEIMIEGMPDPARTKEYVSTIIGQIDRLEHLVQEISDFVSLREPVYDRNVVLPFFQKTVAAFQAHFLDRQTRKIDIVIEGPSSFPKCEFDRKQMQTVLVNILKNACDAISGAGRIVIRLSCDKEFLNVSVADNGSGMSEEVRQRAFEAFFTTRRPERTGLGLAVSKSIIERHGGTIALASGTGPGTTVEIRIPLSQEVAHEREKKEGPSHRG